MTVLLRAWWEALRADEGLAALFGLESARAHHLMAPRGEESALPYITYKLSGAGAGAVWPIRRQLLWFSVYDYASAADRTTDIAEYVMSMFNDKGWVVDPDLAMAVRTYASPGWFDVPTNSEDVWRLDWAHPVRAWDQKGVRAKVSRPEHV